MTATTPREPATLSRRRLLRNAGALAVGGLGLSACSSSFAAGIAGAGNPKQSLNYWNLFGGGDGVRMIAMENAYRKSHPNIELKAVTLAWGNPYYTKLSLATLGDRPPDVAISHLTRARSLAAADLLEPLDPRVLAQYGMTGNKFIQRAWKHAHFNGKLWAIPLDVHPFVLFYRTDLCKKAGLLDQNGKLKPLVGRSAFVGALEKMKKVTGKYGGVISINADVASPWRWFYSMYGQLGGKVLTNEGTKVLFDVAKATKVLDLIREVCVTKQLMPSNIDYGTAIVDFVTGAAGFYLQGEWEITTFQTAKIPFSMAKFPHVFAQGPYACQADSHTFVIPKQPSQAGRDKSMTFIRYLLGQSATWAAGGHIPAWLPYETSKAYAHLEPQSNYADAAQGAIYDPDGWFSGSGSDFETAMSASIAGVESGRVQPATAAKQMRAAIAHYASIPSPLA